MQKQLITALLLSAVVLATGATSHAEDKTAFPKIPSQIDLQDGDTFVFLGDSITHQRLYTQYVEDFFYQRYPNRRIHFHNAGIGGAKAWDALARISRDVLDYKPRYVSILLGMNDGRYVPFNQEIFATYQRDMNAVVAKIREGGATPILMSPTMFDTRAVELRGNARKRPPAMLAEYNSVLAYYGRWLQHNAVTSGLSYVDMYGLLNDLTLEAREDDPNFTLIRDAIHPDPPGQIVMAYAMIDDLGLRKALSNIRLQRGKNGFTARAAGGKVTNLKSTDHGLEFDWLADGLPWVLPEDAQLGVDLLKLGHKATKEGFEVHGLKPGKYELLIDGTSVGTWPSTSFSRHIELQANDKTPQYQQALKVAMLNKQKNDGPVKQLRDGWRTFQGWARMDEQLKTQEFSDQAREALSKKIAASAKKLVGLEENIIASEDAAKKIEDEIYTANQPVTRHYELRLAQ